MLDDIIGALLGFVWAVFVSAILYPIGSIGRSLGLAVGYKRGGYHGAAVGKTTARAMFGLVILVALGIGAYLLWAMPGALIFGGVAGVIVIMGFFGYLVVPENPLA